MKTVIVNDKFQKNYKYQLSEPVGENFSSDFNPMLTPQQMLELGVFGGIYFYDRGEEEFPEEWFINQKKSEKSIKGEYDKDLNYFKIKASQSHDEWVRKGWMSKEDPRGWFQWYCRYYYGRRLPNEDVRQIKRWNLIRRHVSQVANNCKSGDISCRPRQRQAILHWSYDSSIL